MAISEDSGLEPPRATRGSRPSSKAGEGNGGRLGSFSRTRSYPTGLTTTGDSGTATIWLPESASSSPSMSSRETSQPAFDHKRLAAAVAKASGRECAADKLPFDLIALDDHGRSVRFKIGDSVWKCDLASYECTKAAAADAPVDVPASAQPRRQFFQGGPDGGAQGPGERRRSPDGKWMALIKDHNVHLRPADGAEGTATTPLSTDGKEGLGYDWLSWSPDSKTLAAFRVEPGDHKEVYLIQTSPSGGGRARFRARPYDLPGDKFASYELNVFDIGSKKQIKPAVDRIDYDEPHLRWGKDGRRFSYEKVDRGHQRFRVVEVDAQTGQGAT